MLLYRVIFITAFYFSLPSLSADSTHDNQKWRYEVSFSCEDFLTECRHDLTCSRFMASDSTPYRSTWKTLFALRDYYARHQDQDKLIHTYHVMAKLLLSTDEQPIAINARTPLQILDTRGQHISTITGIFTEDLVGRKTNNKLKKWSYVYNALLLREWANRYSQHRPAQLRKAYEAISKATALKTTRTTYLIAAQIILDDGYTPQGLTREEAIALAQSYVQKAFTPVELEQQSETQQNPPVQKEFIVKQARPPYIDDILSSSSSPAESHEQGNEEPATEDPLAHYDFSQLTIAFHQAPAELPIRRQAIHMRGTPTPFLIGQERFVRQNVSGINMDCFFNSLGLYRANETEKLKAHENDPMVRFMVANEILSMVEDPAQLNDEVRAAIDFHQFEVERASIAELQHERGDALLSDEALAENLDGQLLLARDHQNEANLRIRAMSSRAFKVFVRYLEQPGTMMGALSDVVDGGLGNFTAIDAIAFLNDLALRIYNADGVLIHEFIPANAKELQYLYFEGSHFQALYKDERSDDEMAVDEEDDYEEEDGNDEFPSSRELKRAFPNACSTRIFSTHAVRQILYLSTVKKFPNSIIANRFNVGSPRISDALIANGVRHLQYHNDDVKEKVFQWYLNAFGDIAERRITRIAFCKLVADKIAQRDLTAEKVDGLLSNGSFKLKRPLPAQTKQDIVDAYRRGVSLVSILADNKDVSGKAIFAHLSETLTKDELRPGFSLAFARALSKKERDELILSTFEQEKAKNNGEPVAILRIVKLLESHKISYKAIKHVLDQAGVATITIAHHLSPVVADQIREDFARKNPERGQKIVIYRQLAQKYGVTVTQVEALFSNIKTTFAAPRPERTRDFAVKAYHELSPAQKANPVDHVKQALDAQGHPVTRKSVSKYLREAGLYAPKKQLEAATLSLGKRARADQEQDGSSDDESALSKRARREKL